MTAAGYAFITIYIGLAGGVSCADKKEKIPLSSDSLARSYQILDSSTIYFYGGDKTMWKLESEHMKKPLKDTGNVLSYPVRLTLYDTLQGSASIVLSDSGTTNPDMNRMTVWGNVFIRTRDSLVVKSEKLWWIKEKSKIYSDTFVQIETPTGDILRGKGLEATETFSRWSLKENVSGRFPDFKNRLETKETDE
jgi:LPS export ABC transporter protein LptC